MRLTSAWAAAAAVTLVTACGGGGGGGSAPVNPGTTHYEIGVVGPSSSGSITFADGAKPITSQALVAVDPANPQRGAITIEPAGSAILLRTFAGVTPSGGQFVTGRSRHTVYIKDGGLYRIDHDVAAGSLPTAKRVSSVTTASLCPGAGFPFLLSVADAAAPDKSWFFLTTPGTDGACATADDAVAAIRIDAGTGTAPLATSGLVRASLRDPVTGALTGFVATSATQAFRLDLAMNSTPLFALTGPIANLGTDVVPGFPGLWFRVEGGALQVVNLAAPATSVNVAAVQPGETVWQIASDGVSVFAVVNGGGTARILKFPVAPLGAATEIAQLNQFVDAISLTPTRVVALSASGLVSVPKTGGASTPLLTFFAPDTAAFMLTSGENVYTEVHTPVSLVQTRSRIDVRASDGSNPFTFADTRLVAGQFPRTTTITSGSQPTVLHVASPATTRDMAGATLRSIDGATRAPLLTYGTLPAATPGVLVSSVFNPYGDPMLFEYSNGVSSDLYVVDTDAANSLARITNLLAASVAGGRVAP